MKESFTPEQEKALATFDDAVSSHDFNAIGHTRAANAHKFLVRAYTELERVNVTDALTGNELAKVRFSRAWLAEHGL